MERTKCIWTACALAGLWFLLSCLIRYVLEVTTNFWLDWLWWEDQLNWSKYWRDSSCEDDEGRYKLICRAYEVCINEFVPAFFPTTTDDYSIQFLLVVIMKLLYDRLYPHQKPKND